MAGIERSGYIAAEERTVNELKAIGKPFVIVLNCREPQSEQSTICAPRSKKSTRCPFSPSTASARTAKN